MATQASSVIVPVLQAAEQPPKLVFVEGSFDELALEIAEYFQIADQIQPLLAAAASREKTNDEVQDQVLGKLIEASASLHKTPERDFAGASNLLIALVLRSPKVEAWVPRLCATFAKPVASSPVHGVALSLNALTTIFNLLPVAHAARYPVLLAILAFLKDQAMWEVLQPYLNSFDAWAQAWNLKEEEVVKLYEEVVAIALEAGQQADAYQYLLKALRTFSVDNAASESAQKLSLQAIRMALLSSTQFLFHELRVTAPVQALADVKPAYAQLLEVFAEQELEDFNDFNEEHRGFLEAEGLNADVLDRKIRLLTFASLAAATPTREIPYSAIVKALRIDESDVELWAIDAIRVGLVEGKLSQQKKLFLVHKITYRIFGLRQWQELSTRVDQWRGTLRSVLDNLLQAREDLRQQQEQEAQQLERKLTQGQDGRPSHHHHHHHNNNQNRHHNNRDGNTHRDGNRKRYDNNNRSQNYNNNNNSNNLSQKPQQNDE